MRFLEKSKQYLQKRFMKEYIRALEEKQQQSEGNTVKIPNTGAVVLFKGEARIKQCGSWGEW